MKDCCRTHWDRSSPLRDCPCSCPCPCSSLREWRAGSCSTYWTCIQVIEDEGVLVNLWMTNTRMMVCNLHSTQGQPQACRPFITGQPSSSACKHTPMLRLRNLISTPSCARHVSQPSVKTSDRALQHALHTSRGWTYMRHTS
jgi:hypothetical protein